MPPLGFTNQLNRFLAANVTHMIGTSRFLCQAKIPLNGLPFAFGRNSRNAMRFGICPGMNSTAGRNQTHILAVGGNQAMRIPAFVHGLPHGILVPHTTAIIREASYMVCHGRHISDLSHTLLSHGNAAIGQYPDDAIPANDGFLFRQMFRGVRRWIQVWHGAHHRVATVCSRLRACCNGLLIRKSRLTQVNMHICKARKKNKPFAIQNTIRIFSRKNVFRNRNTTVLDDEIHRRQMTTVPHQAILKKCPHACPLPCVILPIIQDFAPDCNRFIKNFGHAAASFQGFSLDSRSKMCIIVRVSTSMP